MRVLLVDIPDNFSLGFSRFSIKSLMMYIHHFDQLISNLYIGQLNQAVEVKCIVVKWRIDRFLQDNRLKITDRKLG